MLSLVAHPSPGVHWEMAKERPGGMGSGKGREREQSILSVTVRISVSITIPFPCDVLSSSFRNPDLSVISLTVHSFTMMCPPTEELENLNNG